MKLKSHAKRVPYRIRRKALRLKMNASLALRWIEANRLVSALSVIVILLVANYALLRPSGFDERNAFIRTCAQVLGGFALLAGLYYTHQTVENSRRTLDHSRRTLDQQRDNLQTERFYEAIEQLGHDNEGVRIGALYSLKWLFSYPNVEKEAIIEIIGAFVRSRASIERAEGISKLQDVEHAMITLGVLRKATPKLQYFSRVRLDDLDLGDVTIDNGDYHFLSFKDSNLQGSFLARCDFSHASFAGTNLSGSMCIGCNMGGASFSGTDLQGASLATTRNLTWKQIEEATIDEQTTLPDYLLENSPDWYIAAMAMQQESSMRSDDDQG